MHVVSRAFKFITLLIVLRKINHLLHLLRFHFLGFQRFLRSNAFLVSKFFARFRHRHRFVEIPVLLLTLWWLESNILILSHKLHRSILRFKFNLLRRHSPLDLSFVLNLLFLLLPEILRRWAFDRASFHFCVKNRHFTSDPRFDTG